MTTIDERARRAAAQLRATADASVDHEAGLNRIHHTTGGRTARPGRNTPRLLAAAAAIAVIVAGITVLATRPASAPVADQPEVEEPLPTLAPITAAPTVPATDPAATTPPSTPTTPPATVSPSTPPERPAIVPPVPVLDVTPRLEPLDLPACGPVDCSVASDPNGMLVVLDARTGTFTIDADAGPGAMTVTPVEPLGDQADLIAIGPGLVAYVSALGDPSQAPALDLLAVALEGDRAGQVIRRLPGVVDGSGDTDLARTARGLVAVGCCGSDTLRPDPDREPVMPWLTPDGEPTTEPGPHVFVELENPHVYGVLIHGDAPQPYHLIPADSWFRGMPLVAVVGEADYLLAWTESDGTARLVRVSGTVDWVPEIVVPDGYSVVGLDVRGAVLFDGAQFFRWQLPSLAAPQDVTALVGSWLPAAASEPAELVDAVLAHLRSGDDCEVPPSAMAAPTQTSIGARGEDIAASWIIHRAGCDDSVGGAWIAFSMVRDGTTWKLWRATSYPLCLRGGTDLCI